MNEPKTTKSGKPRAIARVWARFCQLKKRDGFTRPPGIVVYVKTSPFTCYAGRMHFIWPWTKVRTLIAVRAATRKRTPATPTTPEVVCDCPAGHVCAKCFNGGKPLTPDSGVDGSKPL